MESTRWPRTRRVVTLLAASVLVAGSSATSAHANGPAEPQARALAQIAELQRLKKSLSAVERKLDSRLAIEMRKRSNRTATDATPKLRTGVQISANGTTPVVIHADKVDDGLLRRLRGVGATVRYPSQRTDTVFVDAPVAQLDAIASWSEVGRVTVPSGFQTSRTDAPGRRVEIGPAAKSETAEQVASALRSAPVSANAVGQGAVVSEGDRAHAADTARSKYKVTGVGVKVCAISDGVLSLNNSVAAGELPGDVDVLPGQAGQGDEGTAMLEIIHDLAPSAKLGFATAYETEENFADNILALRFSARCDIIVDDILYYHEAAFQDGLVAQAVSQVIADGAFYFSSAGNDGNTMDGSTGNYEADFVDSGRSVAKFVGKAHDFNPGSGVQIFNPLSASSTGKAVTLWWNDPLGASANDYDMYVVDADGNVVTASQDTQDGDADPFEFLGTEYAAGQRLAVVKFSGEDRYFQLSALRGRFADTTDGLKAYTTPGVTRGHSAVQQAFSVAAAPASVAAGQSEPGDPASPAGPYPQTFTRTSSLERFTSDGPRRIFFQADGTPVTPGNLTSSGGEVRQKPDIAAADGVATSVWGFQPFFGTSAAAPHAAAIAALTLSGNPGMTNAELRTAMTRTALDLAPAGVDARSGHGMVRADLLLKDTGATPQPLVQVGKPITTPKSGDGDPYLEPGEKATVSLPAVNVGDGKATSVSVTLATDDPRAKVTAPQRYGTLAPGASKFMGFTLTLAKDYPVGRPVTLTAKATFVGVLSPTTGSQLVATGQVSTEDQVFAYAGPPVAIPDSDQTGITATIDVTGVGSAADMTFSIDGTECSRDPESTTVGLSHPYIEDVTAILTAPNGTSARLFTGVGFGGANMCQVVFDDSADQPITKVQSAQAPFTGRWRPVAPLAPLYAAPVDGTWTLSMTDTIGGLAGTLRAFSLHFKTYEA
ncbi:S8 family serine peptidase [Micromonospora chokoriensis]|uniref:S8 family serine peptidase n=1 Tax=Micromonospora chokoriensis TaxID=356851 RepID=UPI000A060D65|nr:S8 family serine peptidase [Micromonospora chokoriensis]